MCGPSASILYFHRVEVLSRSGRLTSSGQRLKRNPAFMFDEAAAFPPSWPLSARPVDSRRHDARLMSALSVKADIALGLADVAFGPEADLQ